MPKYRIDGVVYVADSPADARKMAAEEGDSDYWGNFLRTVGQGLSLSAGDEIEAGFRTGFGFGGDYKSERDRIRGEIQGFAKDNPGTALGAEIAGGLLTGGVGGAKVLGMKALQNAPKALTMLGVGAAEGGIQGAGQAKEIENMMTDVPLGMAVGGAGTAIMGPVMKAGQAVADRLPRRAAERNVRRALDESDINDVEAAKAALQGTGPGGVIGDISEATKYNLSPAALEPGPGRIQAKAFADERLAKQDQQVDNLSNWAAGSAETPMQRTNTLRQARTNKFEPQYDILKQATVDPTDALSILKTNQGKSAFNDAAEMYRIEYPQAPEMSIEKAADIVDLEFWDNVQSILRENAKNMKNRQGKKKLAKGVDTLRERLLGTLDDQVPGYSEVRKNYRKASGAIDAIKEGQDIFLKKSGSEIDVIDKINKMDDEGRQEFLLGVMNEVKDRIVRRPEDANSVRQIVMYPATQRKLRAAFDDDAKFEAFNQQLKTIYNQGETVGMFKGSPTAQRIAENKGLTDAISPLNTLAQGRPIAAASQAIGIGAKNAIGNLSRAQKKRIVELYLKGGIEGEQALERVFKGGDMSKLWRGAAVSLPAAGYGASQD